jgi:hypothetical protein
MNILLVHGIDTSEATGLTPYPAWETAISNGLTNARFNGPLQWSPFDYNTAFTQFNSSPAVYAEAVAQLLASAAVHGLFSAPRLATDAQLPPGGPPGTGGSFTDTIRWSAGMVAQWVEEDGLRTDLRNLLADQITTFKPDVICAHSLGTLLCYDLFINGGAAASVFKTGTLITFGTQIGNTFVQDKMWNGKVSMIPVGKWFNLYNPHDPVFVAPVNVQAPNFTQFTTQFGGAFFDESGHNAYTEPGANHPGYLDNPISNSQLWPLVAGGTVATMIERNLQIMKGTPRTTAALTAMRQTKRKHRHTYRYHPPRADHPLFKSTRRFKAFEGAPATPPAADLRDLCMDIRDQGQEGACSGFATAAFREVSHRARTGTALPEHLSPAYLYARTRIEDGTFPNDSGASIAEELTALQNYGDCPESAMPYTADPTAAPTPADDVAALPYRFPDPVQVDFSQPADIKAALAAQEAVIIGFTVYESFENPDANGLLTLPNTSTEEQLGGHAVLVVGYDDVKQYWIVRNSWGPTWGAAGYCMMPYGYEQYWMEAWTGPALA